MENSRFKAPARLRRFACMLYEGVLLFGVVFIAGWLFDTLTQSRDGLMLRHARQAVLFVAIGVYFLLCWRRGGQTLPMKTWDIRLVDSSGKTPAFGQLLARYLLLWPLPLLGALLIYALAHASGWQSVGMLMVFAPFTVFIWSWQDHEGQFLHDRLLGTRIIDTRAS